MYIEPEDHEELHEVNACEDNDSNWKCIKTVLDSGAAESVAPASMAPGVEIEESDGNRRGQCYTSAWQN